MTVDADGTADFSLRILRDDIPEIDHSKHPHSGPFCQPENSYSPVAIDVRLAAIEDEIREFKELIASVSAQLGPVLAGLKSSPIGGMLGL